MATKAIVPRADGEGSLGTTLKRWGAAYTDLLVVDNLSFDGNSIISTDTDGDLNLTPNGNGDLVLDGLKWPQADGTNTHFLQTNGSGQLAWAASGAGDLLASNNLSDVASASTSRSSLGLGTAAVEAIGTSGANVPLMSTANAWTGKQTITTSSDAAIRLDSSGSSRGLDVNKSGTVNALHVVSSSSGNVAYIQTSGSGVGNAMLILNAATNANVSIQITQTANTGNFADWTGASSGRAYCENDGDWYNKNGTYGTVSDAELKIVHGGVSSQWDDVKQMADGMVKYNFKTSPDDPQLLGWTAQFLQGVAPGLVKEGGYDEGLERNVLAVKLSIANLKLFKAFGESQHRIEASEAKAELQDARIIALEAAVASLLSAQ